MNIFILIITLLDFDLNGAAGNVFMQEFRSEDKCNEAGFAWLDQKALKLARRSFVCVKK